MLCLEHREEANTVEWNEEGREWAGRGQSSGGGQTLGGLEERRLGLSLRAEWSAVGTVCPVLKECTIKEL